MPPPTSRLARNTVLDAVQDVHYLGAKRDMLQWKRGQSSVRGGAELAVLDAQRATFEVNEKNRQADLDALELRAPNDGVLMLSADWSGQKPAIGSNVNAGFDFGSLPDAAAMEVELALPQIEAQGVRVGDVVELHPAGRPEQKITSTLSWVASGAKVRSRENPVKYLSMKAPIPVDAIRRYALVPGQRLQARIVLLRASHALSVANVAVRSDDGKTFVQVRDGDGFDRREVKLGVRGPRARRCLRPGGGRRRAVDRGRRGRGQRGHVRRPADAPQLAPALTPASRGGPPMNMRVAKLPPTWREAIEELWRRRLRTLLTLLGLIFGVGAIVAMQAVGEGSQREALRLVESLGLHNLIAEARPQDADTLKETRARSLGLSIADAQAALRWCRARNVSPPRNRSRPIRCFSDSGSSDAQASGVSADYFALSSLHVAQGRALTRTTKTRWPRWRCSAAGRARAVSRWQGARPASQGQPRVAARGRRAGRPRPRQDQFEGVQLGGESNRIYVPLASAHARFRFQRAGRRRSTASCCASTTPRPGGRRGRLRRLLDQRHAGVADYDAGGAAAVAGTAPEDPAHLPAW